VPTYAYACKSCGARTEVIQKITDAPLTTCESCGGVLQRLLFPVGIVFKGPGFHVNDYPRNGGAASANGHRNGNGKSPESDGKPASETKQEVAATGAD